MLTGVYVALLRLQCFRAAIAVLLCCDCSAFVLRLQCFCAVIAVLLLGDNSRMYMYIHENKCVVHEIINLQE